MRAPEFWNAPAGLVAGLLAPAGTAWAAAGSLRRLLTHPYRATVPVVCVGNVVAGGSGKTPIVLGLAAYLAERGVAAQVVTRGYGGRLAGPVRVDPTIHDAIAVGDEALLLAARLPCWVARDRAAGIRAAAAAGAPLVLLDDGFQNPTIAKDLSLLVVDAAYGFGNNRVMPAGPLREPVEAALARADAIVLLGNKAGPAALRTAHRPIIRAAVVPADPLPWHGKRVFAFAGIGRPAKFFDTLRSVDATVAGAAPFPDHHSFSKAELTALRRDAERNEAVLVTTEKDWVRLPPEWRESVGTLTVEVLWHDRSALVELLQPLLAGCAR
jgi:tetraacyldisaccharide 4'-kinase